jgi:hypothetical protein
MSIIITSLRTDYKTSECPIYDNVNYIIVNATFKIEDGDTLYEMVRSDSEQWKKTLTIDDPEKFDQWCNDTYTQDNIDDLLNGPAYMGYSQSWVINDPPWQYIEKFNTFHFREWIADSSVTRAILNEIQYYKDHGTFPNTYRSTDDWILLKHFMTLGSYWD